MTDRPQEPAGRWRPSGELLATVCDVVAEGVLVIGAEGVVWWANPAAERWFQRSADALSGREWRTLFQPVGPVALRETDVSRRHPGGKGALSPIVGDGPSAGSPAAPVERGPASVAMPPTSGRVQVTGGGLAELRVVPAPGLEEGAVVAILTDVEAGWRLAESEARYRAIVEAFDGLIYICSPDFRVEYLNPRMIERSGYDGTGDLCYRVLHRRESVCPWCVNDRVFAGETVRWEVKSPLDGRWYYVVNTPIFHPDGMRSKQSMIIDIDERKRAEETRRQLEQELARSQKLESLGLMAGGLAHDFGNLLTVIRGHLELAKLAESMGRAPTEHIAEALAGVARAASLTRQMLDYAGRGGVERVAIRVDRFISERHALWRSVVPPTVSLDLRVAAAVPPVAIDGDRLERVLLNLLINAGEAIGNRAGRIALAVDAEDYTAERLAASRHRARSLAPGRLVSIRVIDDGCGMDEATRERLFDPFFSTRFTGRGLGMAAVLGVVQRSGGAVFVESEPGRGTTIELAFPLAPEPEPEGPAATGVSAVAPGAVPSPANRPETGTAPEPPDLGRQDASPTHRDGAQSPVVGDGSTAGDAPSPRVDGKRPAVLVIDDEAGIRQVCELWLPTLGFAPLLASDGRQGIEKFRQHARAVVAVILDLTMPDQSGMEVLAQLRAIDPAVPVILVSGFDRGRVGEVTELPAAVEFVEKPFRLESLGSLLRQLARSPG